MAIGTTMAGISALLPFLGKGVRSLFDLVTPDPKPGEELTVSQKIAGKKAQQQVERVPLSQEEEALKSAAIQQLQQSLPFAMQQMTQPSQIQQALMPQLMNQVIPQLSMMGAQNPIQGAGGYNPYGLGQVQQPSFGQGLSGLLGGLMPLLQMYQLSQAQDQSLPIMGTPTTSSAQVAPIGRQVRQRPLNIPGGLNIPEGYAPGGIEISPEGQRVKNYVDQFRKAKRK